MSEQLGLAADRGRPAGRSPQGEMSAAVGEITALLATRLCALRAGGRIVVAYSGGADSLALLALLLLLPEGVRPAVEAIHVDHGLRAGSAAEAARAVEAAAALGAEARVVRVEVAGRGGVEAAARRARYRALAAVAAGRPILTAHTLDDQAETVLLRLARGSGIKGAAGILPRTRLAGARVLRPLLGVRRAALREVVAALGLQPLEDPSNRDLRFARNRLRAEVLPALQALAPGAVPALGRFAALAEADERYLASRAARAARRLARGDGLDAAGLLALPLALQRRIVRERLAAVAGRAPAAARIAEVLELLEGGGELHLPKGTRVTVREGIFLVERGPTGQAARHLAAERAHGSAPAPLAPGKPLHLGAWRLDVEGPIPMPAAPAPGECWTTAAPPYLARAVRRGERLPVPGTGHRLASDLVAEARIPRAERGGILVVEGADEPIWLVGVRPLRRRPAPGEPAFRLRASKQTPA